MQPGNSHSLRVMPTDLLRKLLAGDSEQAGLLLRCFGGRAVLKGIANASEVGLVPATWELVVL